jgi:hypothetical protein
MAAILALLTTLAAVAWSTAVAPPAHAHSCGLPAHFDVAVPGNLTIGAAAEANSIVAVDVTVPATFRVDAILPTVKWTSERTPTGITFRGGPITPFACAFFTVRGEALRKGVIALELTTHAEDGTVQQYRSRDPGDLYAAQLVLAGVELPDPSTGGGGGSGSSSPGTLLLVAGGAGGVALWVIRRRRQPQRPPPGPRRPSGRGRGRRAT